MTETRKPITLVTRKGRSVETTLTNEEAYAMASAIGTPFAKSLTDRPLNSLSGDQITWLHILVLESNSPRQEERVEVPLDNLHAMLAKAGAALKHPRIRVLCGAGGGLVLTESNGAVYVKAAGEYAWSDRHQADMPVYYGKIVDGLFQPSQKSSDAVVESLVRFAKNPLEEATQYGKLTGNCCFCGRKLTDKASTQNGFGPICAGRFGL